MRIDENKIPKRFSKTLTFKQQTVNRRSTTPRKNDSRSSQNDLRKQYSHSSESKSGTPEDIPKKGSQISLNQNRSHTPSRCSSSSSYSGVDFEVTTPHRKSRIKNPKTSDEYRIRRSR